MREEGQALTEGDALAVPTGLHRVIWPTASCVVKRPALGGGVVERAANRALGRRVCGERERRLGRGVERQLRVPANCETDVDFSGLPNVPRPSTTRTGSAFVVMDVHVTDDHDRLHGLIERRIRRLGARGYAKGDPEMMPCTGV